MHRLLFLFSSWHIIVREWLCHFEVLFWLIKSRMFGILQKSFRPNPAPSVLHPDLPNPARSSPSQAQLIFISSHPSSLISAQLILANSARSIFVLCHLGQREHQSIPAENKIWFLCSMPFLQTVYIKPPFTRGQKAIMNIEIQWSLKALHLNIM